MYRMFQEEQKRVVQIQVGIPENGSLINKHRTSALLRTPLESKDREFTVEGSACARGKTHTALSPRTKYVCRTNFCGGCYEINHVNGLPRKSLAPSASATTNHLVIAAA